MMTNAEEKGRILTFPSAANVERPRAMPAPSAPPATPERAADIAPLADTLHEAMQEAFEQLVDAVVAYAEPDAGHEARRQVNWAENLLSAIVRRLRAEGEIVRAQRHRHRLSVEAYTRALARACREADQADWFLAQHERFAEPGPPAS